MLVFQITHPGTWLRHPDQACARRIQPLLGCLEDQLANAVVALNLFQRQHVADAWRPSPAREAMYDANQQAVEDDIRHELGEEEFFRNFLAVQAIVEQEVRRRLWAQGEIPVEYARRLPFLYAHLFVYALDSFGKILYVLSKEDGTPQAIRVEYEGFVSALPHLKALRDSAHHIEARARALDRRGQPIRVRALELSNLWGDKLAYTAEDGQLAEVPINETSARVASSALQRVIDAFDWEGRMRITPY